MAAPTWFTYETYMNNKLADMQKADKAYTMDQLVASFKAAGFGGDTPEAIAEGAYNHFVAYGAKEDIAPNAFFNANEYYEAKAAEFFKKPAKDVTAADVANVKGLIIGADMNAWSHYVQYGTKENVNASNQFNTKAYMDAKLLALQSSDPEGKWDMAKLNDAFKAAGLSALEHFMLYGGTGNGEVAQKYDPAKPTVMPAAFSVPEDQKVNPGAPGQTFTLTTGIDTWTGSAADDTVIGVVSATGGTVNVGDSVDGGAGWDTLKVSATTVVNLTGTTFKNVEEVQITATTTAVTTVNLGGAVSELQKLTVAGGTTGSLALQGFNSSSLLTLKDLAGAATVTYADLSATATGAATIAVDGAKDTSGLNVANVNNLTLQAVGTKSTLVSVSGDAQFKNLTIGAGTDLTLTTVTGSALETISANGAGKVTINGLSHATVKTVTAGDGDFYLSAGASVADGLTFTGGAGNDTLKLNYAKIDKAASLNGGAGTDTLIIADTFNGSAAASYAAINKATGFEILGFGAAATVDMSQIKTAFDHYAVYGAGSSYSATFDKIATGTKFSVDFASAASGDNAFNVLTLNALKGGATLDLSLNAGLTGASTLAGLEMANVSTLNLHSNGSKDSTVNTISAATWADGMSVNIDGSASASITSAFAGKNVWVDASGMTGEAKLNYTASGGVENVIGTINNDTFKAGVGLDVFHGGKGADSVVMTSVTSAANKLTLTFDDGDSTGIAGSLKLSDMLSGKATWDAVTGVANGTSTANDAAHLTLDTKQDGTNVKTLNDITAFATAGDLGKVAVAKAGDFLVVLEGGTSMAVVFQDTNMNGVIDADDFMITLTGTGAWVAGDFTVAGGNLNIANHS